MRRGEEVQRVYQTFDSLELFSTAAAIAIGRFGQGIGSKEGNVKEVSGSPKTQSNIPINVPRTSSAGTTTSLR
jgi:hypothetical protein